MPDVRNQLRWALFANAGAVAVPAVVVMLFWMPDLIEMGRLGVLLAAAMLVPAAVVAAIDTVLARQVARSTRRRSATFAAVVGLAQFVVAVVGVAEATDRVESACFLVVGATALAVALAGVVASLRTVAVAAAPHPRP